LEEETVEEVADEVDPIAELSAKLDRLIELMTPTADKEEVVEEEAKEEVKEELDEIKEALGGEEELTDEAQVVEAEEMSDGCKALNDSVANHILKTVRPAIAKIEDEKLRKEVSDALIGAVHVKSDDVEKVMDAQASYKAEPKTNGFDVVQDAYMNMNPHTRKEN
jgi:hypothetical protein